MNFWKGLLKQIAKCSLLTDGKRERERERKEILSSREKERDGEFRNIVRLRFADIRTTVPCRRFLAAGKPSPTTREKRILAKTSAANEILPLGLNGMFVRNRD